MSDVTLKAIEELLDNMFDKKLEPIQKTLDAHTAALEQVLTEKKNREDEKIVNAHRFERLEQWATLAGKKLGIKLEL